MEHYKPYSPEWHRKRCLKEALDNYLDNYIDNDIIMNDILNILNEKSESAYADFKRINDLENLLGH
jgi:hypothetical protein